MMMSSAVCSSSVLCWLSSTSPATKLAACPISCSSTTVLPRPKTAKFHLYMWVTPLCLGHTYPYSGLKNLGISTKFKHRGYTEKPKRCRGKVIQASLFGIGAPEALVIGVVALLVFGPKGLAEVARNLGKTFREFQPTIRELQEVSREFKSSLEREIGIDDMSSSPGSTYRNNIPSTTTTSSSSGVGDNSQTVANPDDVVPNPEKAYTTEDYLKVTQEQLKASLAKQLEQTPSLGADQIGPEINLQASEGTSATPQVEKGQNHA